MNYIWDLVIRAHHAGVPKEKITFALAKTYSPYMELSNENLNFRQVEPRVEINPYYRFYEIFKDLFNINNHEDVELRNTLLDIAIHFLTDINLIQGMNKTEYYQRFIQSEIQRGLLGPEIQAKFGLLTEAEQIVVTENYYRLLITGEMLYLLKDTVRQIFKSSTIYVNYETTNELLFFIACEKSDLNEEKLALIKELFLPLKFSTLTYWKDHFGVIGMDETMKIDNIALY
ncbi:MAG TPA: iron-dependent peroxidase [Bacillota bacterium]|nr:iron-dependent peroxidase [Bacillota bacterium]